MLAALLYVAVNTVFNVSAPNLRLDVTEDGLYTLSRGTLATLANIDEPLVFHFFLSDQLAREVPFYASFGLRVRELLVEITAAAGGKIVFDEHDPEPFSDSEDLAVSLGVQGIPIGQGSDLAYFGLAGANSVDETELIPFFQPEREKFLEYDIAQMIHALSNPEPTVVGVMSSLPIMGDMRARMQGGVLVPWAIASRLNANFDLINLPESIDALPPTIDVLMVVHPRAMSERALYELEQFLFRGGRALLFIDPKSESDRSVSPLQLSSSADGLKPLFAKWGIRIPEGQLVGDRSMALRINAGSAQRPVPADYLVWLGVTGDNMPQDDPVTSQLPALNLASAGFIVRESGSPLSLEPLISSSRNSRPVDVTEVQGIRLDILGLLDWVKADDEAYVIAARLSGEATTAFPDGPPPRTTDKSDHELTTDPDPPQLMRSNGPIHAIVVADSDLLEERFWLQKREFYGREVEEQIAGNASFVINALGNLAGGDALLNLRTRGVSRRPFDKVKELQRKAERRLQEKERALQDKLSETREKIARLEGVRTIEDAATGEQKVEISLTSQQRTEVEVLRREMLSIRKELRTVQRNLRADVERLETWLQFFNIGLVPIVITVIAVVIGTARTRKRRRYYVGTRKKATA
ncbi:MAG: Gldg family protein [Gammaproteobacteria bacterium]